MGECEHHIVHHSSHRGEFGFCKAKGSDVFDCESCKEPRQLTLEEDEE